MQVLVLTTLLLGLSSCNFHNNSNESSTNTKLIPSIDLLLIDSIAYINTQNYSEKAPIVLFYFGPYCDHSRKIMNSIIRNIELVKDIQFYLITQDSFEDMVSFYKNYRLNKYKNIVVGNDVSKYFYNKLGVKSYPYLEIYGQNRKLNGVVRSEIYAREIFRIAQMKI